MVDATQRRGHPIRRGLEVLLAVTPIPLLGERAAMAVFEEHSRKVGYVGNDSRINAALLTAAYRLPVYGFWGMAACQELGSSYFM